MEDFFIKYNNLQPKTQQTFNIIKRCWNRIKSYSMIVNIAVCAAFR